MSLHARLLRLIRAGRESEIASGPPHNVIWNKREARQSSAHAAQVVTPDGRVHPVLLTNLSGEGVGIRGCDELKIGEICELVVPGNGMLRIQVRWALGGRAGGRFLD